MACRRSISTRGILLTRRLHPAFGCITHEDDAKGLPPAADPSRLTANNFMHSGYNNTNLNGVFSGCAALFRGGGCSSISFRHGLGSSLCSYSSSAIGGGSDKMDYMSNAAEFLTEKSVEVASQAPIASEVAIAAADSYFPVAALQYVIDGVHSFTGLNWWASIALTTLMIRLATIPISIHQIKATSKLALLKPHLEEIKEQMQDMASDPKAFTEGQKRMKALFKEYGVSPFTPMKGLFIQGPVFISFFMAITNMVEKVPSFKEGGVFWFTDLTVPDPLYILPVLTSLTFLITVEKKGSCRSSDNEEGKLLARCHYLQAEVDGTIFNLNDCAYIQCNMQEGMEGNAAAGTMKNFSRIIAVLTIPFTMTFPKAIFCYWITSNLYSLTYGLVIKKPQVKKLLGLPELPVTPPSTSSKPPMSPFALFSSFKAAAKEPALLPAAPSQVSERKLTSSSIMSQRIKTLEKQVKGRKKNKKR